jgi:DNA polymerase I
MATPLPEPGAPDALYLIDLSSYLLRAYHAVAPLSAPNGEPTHAVHGLVTMIERLLRLQTPRFVGVCMDAGRVTFRHQIFAEYKANRPPQPPDLRVQMLRAEEIVRSGGFFVLKKEGVEADDLIASVATWADAQGLRVVIVGADKDLMQLASERVMLWDTMQNRVFGPSEVEEKFGVSPAKLGDLLALTGDSSDNVPGVPSVGPKTAAKLLAEFGDLESILENASSLPQKKLKEMLLAHAADARLSRRLVELDRNCAPPVELADFALGAGKERDDARVMALFEELGFTRQLSSLKNGGSLFGTPRGQAEAPKSEASRNAIQPHSSADVVLSPPQIEPTRGASSLHLFSEPAALHSWLEARKDEELSLELFTLSPEHHRGPIIGASITGATEACYLPFRHRTLERRPQFPLEALAQVFRAELGRNWITFHAKRQRVLLGSEFPGLAGHDLKFDDALLAAYLVDPERRHSLESLAVEAGQPIGDFSALSKEGRQHRQHDELSEELVAPWARERGQVLLSSMSTFRERLGEFGLTSLYQEIELPLSEELADMEMLGVLIDTTRLSELGAICDRDLTRLEQQAIEIVGKPFNVNSPRQLETILFDDLGLKPQKRTKTARSTDAQTLEVLSEEHPLPDVILEHRQVAKLKSTYLDALPALVDPKSGRVHSAWEQAVAATGRLSSVDPNLQNIPIRSELGRKIRAAFIAPPGYHLVSADYSQIELRILAHLSEDERLLEAFRTGQDVHQRTAMEIFDVPADQVTREMRSRAKAVNFGVIYGQGEGGLSKALRIDRRVAADFIAKYFARYHGVRAFLDQTLSKAREGETVTTLLGRRRILPDIKSGNRARRLAAERIATNLPIQGSAADILKIAMLKFREPVTPGARLVLTVHDELVFEVPLGELDVAKPEIVKRMSEAYPLAVPLEVTAGDGPDWNSAH